MEEQKELPSIYISSDGKQTPIIEMNNFHLVNSMVKVHDVLCLNPNGFGDAKEEYEAQKSLFTALKNEVLKRMDNRIEA